MKVNQKKAGVLLSYLSEAVKIITTLIYTPIMLRLLGTDEYGLYQLVSSVVSYLSLLSLGFTASYIRFYSRYKAKDDTENIYRLNGMFMTIFVIIMLVCFGCGIVMISNIRHIFSTGLTDSQYGTARVLMMIMVLNLGLSFPNSVFNCIISAHERFFFQRFLMLAHNILNPFLSLPLLILGFGSIGLVSVTTFLTIATLLLNMYYCLKVLNAKFIFNKFEKSLLVEISGFTFFIFLNQIIDQINWSVDKFLLGRLSGTTAVAIYGLGSQINHLYVQLSTSISSVFVPKINKIVAANEEDSASLTDLFTRVGRIQYLILALVLTGYIFFGRRFMNIWGGKDYDQSYFVTLLLIIPVTIPLIQNLGIEIQRAKNMHKARSVVYFCIAISNIFISIPLIKLLGPSGAALGTCISLFVGNGLFMNWYYHNRIHLDVIYFWKSIAQMSVPLIIPVLFGIFALKFANYNNLMIYLSCIVIYTILYCLAMYYFGMNSYEKQLIYSGFSKLRRRSS